MNLIINVFKKTFDFYSRSRRKEFWTYAVVSGSLLFFLIFYSYFFTEGLWARLVEVFTIIVGVVVLMPMIALIIRRLHDTGRSGWWGLVVLVPVLGQIVFLAFMAENSQIGYNEYGEYSKFEWSKEFN